MFKRLLLSLLVLNPLISSANEEDNPFSNQWVSPPFRYNDHLARQISNCLSPDENTNCINFIINRKAFGQLLNNEKLVNQMESNKDMTISANLGGELYAIYPHLKSIFVIQLSEHKPESKEISFRYNTVLINGDTHNWFDYNKKTLTVSGENYDSLMSLAQ
ncbi:hypothetical protein ACXHQN_01340 [Vibrio cincinnatiensis]